MPTPGSDTATALVITVRLADDGCHRVTVSFGNNPREVDIPLTSKIAEWVDAVLAAAQCKPVGDSSTSARIKSDTDAGFSVCTRDAPTL